MDSDYLEFQSEKFHNISSSVFCYNKLGYGKDSVSFLLKENMRSEMGIECISVVMNR